MCKTSASSRNFIPQLIRLAQSSKSNSAVKANPPKMSQIDTLIIFSIEKSGFITLRSSDFLRCAFHIKDELKLLQTIILHKHKVGCRLLAHGWRIHDDPSKCAHKKHDLPTHKASIQTVGKPTFICAPLVSTVQQYCFQTTSSTRPKPFR